MRGLIAAIALTMEGTVAGDVLTGQSQGGSGATRVVSAKRDK